MSYPSKRVHLQELNPHIMCVLCGGYLIQATTVIECLHSFCKSCILNFLETSDVCPICDVKVHKTWPLMNIRLDQTLQSLVYKMVPGLFQDEMRKRREYHWTVSESYVKTLNLEDRGDAVMEKELTTGPDQISMVLQMVSREPENSSLQVVDQRYLLCPAEFTIGHLKKFVRLKFDLTTENKIVMYKAKEELTDDLMLQDVAYIYLWKRDKPLHLFYSVAKNPFLRKRWSSSAMATTKKPISATCTSVSTAIGTFLAREDTPPDSVGVNTTADTKTTPILNSVLSTTETSLNDVCTKTTNKKIKIEEPHHGYSLSQSSKVEKTTSLSTTPLPSSSLPSTFPVTSTTVMATAKTTMSSKCTVTSSSLLSLTSSHKKGSLCTPVSSLILSSSLSSTLTSVSTSSNNIVVLQTNVSPSSKLTSAKQNGATVPVKNLQHGSKKPPMGTTNQPQDKIGILSNNSVSPKSSKKNTETVNNTILSGQPLPSSCSKNVSIHDQSKNRIPKMSSVTVPESPNTSLANTLMGPSSSQSIYKATVANTIVGNKPSYSNTHINEVRTINSNINNKKNISHTAFIPKVVTTTASTTMPKNKVQTGKLSSASTPNKALVLTPDSNTSCKIKSQSSPVLSDTRVKDSVKQFSVPTSATTVHQSNRGRKPKHQQPISLSETGKAVLGSSPKADLTSVKLGHISKGNIVTGRDSKDDKVISDVGIKSQLKCESPKVGNISGVESVKQSGRGNTQVSRAKSSSSSSSSSSLLLSSSLSSSPSSKSSSLLSSPSSSSLSSTKLLVSSPSTPSSPLLANSKRIIHSVESILSPTPKQEAPKLENKTDNVDKNASVAREKPLRVDSNVPKDLNEVTAQYVTTVWKEAFGNTISAKSEKKADACDNDKLLNKQKVQGNESTKLPLKLSSKVQKASHGNGSLLKRPNRNVDESSIVIKSNRIAVDKDISISSCEENKMDYLHVPSSSSSPNMKNHHSKVPNDTHLTSDKNKSSSKSSPVPSSQQHSSKGRSVPPVILHKSISCDESLSWSRQNNNNNNNPISSASPLEKRNWKKRKLSEIDQEFASSSQSTVGSFQTTSTLSQPGTKKRCLTPDIVTKAIVDDFGKRPQTTDVGESKKSANNGSSSTSGNFKDSNDSAFLPFPPHSSPMLLSPLQSPPFKNGLEYHRHLQLQNYLHYHHFHNSNKSQQASLPPILTPLRTASLPLRTFPSSIVRPNQIPINASYLANSTIVVSKNSDSTLNNNYKNNNKVSNDQNSVQPHSSKMSTTTNNDPSSSSSSSSSPRTATSQELPIRFYSNSKSTTSAPRNDKIENDPTPPKNSPGPDPNNNSNLIISHNAGHIHTQADNKLNKIMKKTTPNKLTDKQPVSLIPASPSSSKSNPSQSGSTSSICSKSQQQQYSNNQTKATSYTMTSINHEQRQELQRQKPYHQPVTLPSSCCSATPSAASTTITTNNKMADRVKSTPTDNSIQIQKIYNHNSNTKKSNHLQVQDVTHNISIDVSPGTITNNNNTTSRSSTTTSDLHLDHHQHATTNINHTTISLLPSEPRSNSNMSSPSSQTSPNSTTSTMMTSPRSSLTSPGTDATSPGTEDRPDTAVLPVECRSTSCGSEEGATTPPYAMATALLPSSNKPTTPLDLTNKPRKVQ